jgi:hypothetical protein
MTVEPGIDHDTERIRRPARIGAPALALAIVGALAVFSGLFITFAGETQSLGLWGDLSWTVGEIPDAWTIGFLAGGGVLLVAAVLLVLGKRRG